MKPFDVVKITNDLSTEGINKGQEGTIVFDYGDNHFEVEICLNHKTQHIVLVTVSKEELEVVWEDPGQTT